MDNTDFQVRTAAYFLVNQVRRYFTALLDGTPRLPKRRINYWRAKVSRNAEFWGYPIITKAIVENCATAGITLGHEVFDTTGVFQLCSFLKAVEQPLFDILSSVPAVEADVSISETFDKSQYQATRFHIISGLFSRIKQHELPGVVFLLHGSMADLKFTAFSDVDDLIILHKEAWQEPDALIKTATSLASIARGYQDIDPLEHHGHWVITEFNLHAYDESILPLVVIRKAVLVSGDKEIHMRALREQSGFVRNARNSAKTMQRLSEKARLEGGLNAFELKSLVGEIAIMPAYLFQAKGMMFSKPEAIEHAQEIFSIHAIEALDWATFIRNNFSPLVDNYRMKVLHLVVHLTCPRWYQAETIFRKHASFVSNQHMLGLNGTIQIAIETFIKESVNLVARLAS